VFTPSLTGATNGTACAQKNPVPAMILRLHLAPGSCRQFAAPPLLVNRLHSVYADNRIHRARRQNSGPFDPAFPGRTELHGGRVTFRNTR